MIKMDTIVGEFFAVPDGVRILLVSNANPIIGRFLMPLLLATRSRGEKKMEWS
jgi:hypothetical protein